MINSENEFITFVIKKQFIYPILLYKKKQTKKRKKK